MTELVHRVDTKQIRLVLKLPRFFGARMWLTLRVLALAALISPVEIDVTVEGDGGTEV